jgi:serine/threonine-protein kinase
MEPDPPKLPAVGDVVGGKYRIERVLGRGGMGTVLAVRHLGLDEPRALKLMLPKGLELPQARERFFREARAAAKLRSEHAVAVHDVGVLPDGFPYIEMELLEGSDLSSLLKRSGAVPVAHAVRWIAEACEPVGEAHGLGIVHRDLKPGNLFLARTPTGKETIKVLDFGIAKTGALEAADSTLTGTQASFGSPMYMSPEQMRGARYAEPRSDVWALGVVLFELLTGRRPFNAESVTGLALVVTNDPAPSPRALREDVPPALEAVILRCLAKSPDGRFGSAMELARALLEAYPQAFPLPQGGPPSRAGAENARVGSPMLAVATPLPTAGGPGAPGAAPGWHAQPQPASQPSVPSAPWGDPAAPSTGSNPQLPSHPSVGTLSTTIGGSKGPSPALLVGGALAVMVVGVGLAFGAYRLSQSPTAAPSASAVPLGPAAAASPSAAAVEAAPTPADDPAPSAGPRARGPGPPPPPPPRRPPGRPPPPPPRAPPPRG